MNSQILPVRSLEALLKRRVAAVDLEALATIEPIVASVRADGEQALRASAERFGDLSEQGELWLGPPQLRRSLESLLPEERRRLERVAERIVAFARLQRASIVDTELALSGGRAGQRLAPIFAVGCYAPGGRHPLPSTVLMTALTARVAGVPNVVLASPRPTPLTRAAAAIAQVDGLLCAGGAAAIAAMAYGVSPAPPCDLICGPGNRYVTAAKYWVSRDVAIDMLAGPSELVVVADQAADADWVAADLIAQAEHDVDAQPVLIAVDESTVEPVRRALIQQLSTARNAETARIALARGGAIVVSDIQRAAHYSDVLAPEHLALHLANAAQVSSLFQHYGALFVGGAAGEVLGDYGAGPNHTLPTGGTARARGGLSVLDFLRVRTWLAIDDPEAARELYEDAIWLGRAEGLTGHAHSTELRISPTAF